MKKLSLLTVLLYSFSLTGCLDPTLPKCDSKETKELFFKIVNDSLKGLGRSEQLVSLKNVEEIAFNKQSQIRVCKTDVVLSNAGTGWATYKIYWGKENNSKYEKMFYVEIIETGDYE